MKGTDERLRSLSRPSLDSSPARLLVERLRVAPTCGCVGLTWPWPSDRMPTDSCPECCGFGSTLRARVALAAYCGDEAARLAWPDPTPEGDHPTWAGRHIGYGLREVELAAFLDGLSRWSSKPYRAPVRAALAAAEAVAAHLFAEGKMDMQPILRALDACSAWLEDETAERARACGSFAEESPELPPWALNPAYIVYHGSRGHALLGNVKFAVDAAVQSHPSGEPAIREAINQALIKWALGGET